jgi:capsular exopolysaccharide synthesis family protein
MLNRKSNDGTILHHPSAPAREAAPIGTGFAPSSESLGDLAATLGVINRRRNVITGCVILLTAICIAVVYSLTPRYTAEALVMLDPRKSQVIDLQSVVSGLPADASAVRSEMEVLQSPAMAKRVVGKANLAALPEFNPALRQPTGPGFLGAPVHWLSDRLGSLFGTAPTGSRGPTNPEEALTAIVRRLQDHTEIANDGRSLVLKIRVTSEDAKLAAQLADTYADAYLDSQLAAKFEAVRRANSWLSEHISDLRLNATASDRAVQLFRTQHNLTSLKGTTVTDQQLTELNTQLILAQADRAQKEANLAQLQSQLKSGGLSAAAQVLASPLIQKLREEEAQLVTKEADFATRYKPEHPNIVKIKAQERDLEEKIHVEIDKIVQGLAGEVAAAHAKEASLKQSLEGLQTAAAHQDEAGVQLHQLELENQATRALYEDFLGRFKQTTAQQDIQQADAHLASAAEVPMTPSFPRRGQIIGAGFCGSLILGVFLAFAVERLDNGFRTGEQFERITGIPLIGMIPKVGAGDEVLDEMIRHPLAAFSETIRKIATALHYSGADHPPKVVMVTSSVGREGKTLLAIALARSVAVSGRKALLIDCDLRRPRLAEFFGVEAGPGLLGLFDGDAKRGGLVQIDKKSALNFITVPSGISNPQEVLASRAMAELIKSLRPDYDLIVLDAPPVGPVSDAMVLSQFVDATLFVVRWASTPRTVVLSSLKSLDQAGTNIFGGVLSQVDLRHQTAYGHHAMYYYGDYGQPKAGSVKI